MNGIKYLFSFMMLIAIIIILVVIVDARPTKKELKGCFANPQCNGIFKPALLTDYKVDKSKEKSLNFPKANLLKKKNEDFIKFRAFPENLIGSSHQNKQKLHIKANLHNFENRSKLGTYNLISLISEKGCGKNQTVTIGYKSLNAGLTSWDDKLYLSIGLGASNSKVSISFSKGMCEPLTGVYINGSAANLGKGLSATWYYNNKPSVDKISSSQTIGASIGVTSKIW